MPCKHRLREEVLIFRFKMPLTFRLNIAIHLPFCSGCTLAMV